jgi:hypothetical protein
VLQICIIQVVTQYSQKTIIVELMVFEALVVAVLPLVLLQKIEVLAPMAAMVEFK